MACARFSNFLAKFAALLSVLVFLPYHAEGTPVGSIDLEKFEDDWDYKTVSSKDPILNNVPAHHEIPPASNRQPKENPDPLQVLVIDQNSAPGDSTGAQLGDSVRSKIPCSICELGVGLLQSAVKKGDPIEKIKGTFVSLCVGFEIQNHVVCSGVFDTFAPEVLPVLNHTDLGPKEICRMMFGESCEDIDIPQHEWTVDLPSSKPERKTEKTGHPEVGKSTLKVLHISDTHFDPEYVEGSIANCGEPLCCRNESSPNKKEKNIVPAGRWGAYDNCDVPQILIENMLEHIVKQHPDVDIIYWTGDLPPHDIWRQTKDQSLYILKECVKQMKDAFPNIPILPALGNHEGIPAGSFPPPWNAKEQHSIGWLYEETYKQWKKWLPESEENSILHGGFYSVLVRPGLRVISMNMNYCHSLSWWLLVNSTDPAKELKWLVHQLQQAEDNNEKVHIIGHIPPGVTDCLKTWSENYYKIVDRYEHTITGQFFGHTHADEFEVFYDTVNFTRPTSIAYVGPSVTPYSGQNPAYRIYYVDADSTWDVLDHETWTMDLQKANTEKLDNPKWFKLYSARESYDMVNLSPAEWHKLIYKMAGDSSLFDKFYKNYQRESPVAPKYGDKEKLQILCDLKSGKSQDRHHLCNDLERVFHE